MKNILIFLFCFTDMNTFAQQNTFPQTDAHLSHTVRTMARPEAIWQLWTDVSTWKEWDKGLKEGHLAGEFQAGNKGKLIPSKGPASLFVITEVTTMQAYTFKTRIPLGWLYITRSLAVKEGMTHFTHEVEFTGLLKRPMSRWLGKNYRKMLPGVMDTIKQLAEEKATIEKKTLHD
jgi:hypothetical protein